jgi:hypothetical protein
LILLDHWKFPRSYLNPWHWLSLIVFDDWSQWIGLDSEFIENFLDLIGLTAIAWEFLGFYFNLQELISCHIWVEHARFVAVWD